MLHDVVCIQLVVTWRARLRYWWLSGVVPGKLHGDAEVVINRELITGQHLWPGEAVGLHHRSTAVPDSLAQRPAWVDGPVQTHGCKQ